MLGSLLFLIYVKDFHWKKKVEVEVADLFNRLSIQAQVAVVASANNHHLGFAYVEIEAHLLTFLFHIIQYQLYFLLYRF